MLLENPVLFKRCCYIRQGFVIEVVRTIKEAEEKWEKGKYDLLVLDVSLPDGSGFDFCKMVRQVSNVPIIFLTAYSSETDKIMGFSSGADDYIVKPFSMMEMVSRVKAVLRRFTNGTAFQTQAASVQLPEQSGDFVSYPDLIVNQTNYSVIYQDEPLDMPPKELELLYYLASNPNRVFTRDQLLDAVWSFDYYGDSRTVDVHVKRLREKLEGVSEQWEIRTIWSVGYKFEVL